MHFTNKKLSEYASLEKEYAEIFNTCDADCDGLLNKDEFQIYKSMIYQRHRGKFGGGVKPTKLTIDMEYAISNEVTVEREGISLWDSFRCIDIFIKCTSTLKKPIDGKEEPIVLPDPVHPGMVENWKPYVRIIQQKYNELAQEIRNKENADRMHLANKQSE